MNPQLSIRDGLAFGDLAAKGGLILVAGWIVTLILRKASAASRHLVWLATFCAMLLLPLLMLVMPNRPLAVMHEKPKVVSGPVPEPTESFSNWTPQAMETPASVLGSLTTPTSDSFKAPASSILPKARHSSAHLPDWGLTATVALSLWLLGAVIVFIHWLWGVKSVRTLKTKASHIAQPETFAIDGMQLTQHVGLSRRWELRVSATPRPPTAMTWGLWRPVVLLPQESVSWTHERLEAVLLHELAHVRRLDSVSQLISVAACALYWFNPAVWLGARALRAEAEKAADDTVIRVGIKPSDYARELLRMATDLGHRRQPLSNIGVPVMKQSKIEARVKSILDPAPRSRRGVTLLEALATVGIAGVILLPLTAFRAALVSDPAVVQAPIASIGTFAVPIQPTLGLEQPVQESAPAKAEQKTTRFRRCKVTSTKIRTVRHESTETFADSSDSDVTLPADSPSGDPSDPKVKQENGKAIDQEAKAKAEADKAVAAAAAAQNQVQMREAKLEIERLMSLYKAGIAPVQDVDNAKAKLDRLAADYQLQVAKLKAEQNSSSDNAKWLAKVRELMTALQADHAKMAAEQQLLSKTAHREAERQALKALAEMKAAKLSQIDSKEMVAKIRAELAGQKAAMMAQVEVLRATQMAKRAQSDVIAESLKRARAQVAQAMSAREKTQRLYRAGAISKAEAERVTNALKMAQIQLDLAQKILSNVQQKH